MTHLERLPNSRVIKDLRAEKGRSDSYFESTHFATLFEEWLVLKGMNDIDARYVKDEWAKLKRSFKTLDYPHRVRESGYITYTCSCCGDDKATDSYTHGDVLRDNQLCFSCHYWGERKVEMMLKPKGKLIAGGRMYHLNNGKGEGHGGARFIFKLVEPINGFAFVESRDVWHQGEVPERFKKFFPDMAQAVQDPEWGKDHVYPTPLEVWGK